MSLLTQMQGGLSSFLPASSLMLVLDAIIASAALVLVLGLMRKQFKPSGLPLPPGPKPSRVPLVGNIPDMPSSQEWLTFTEWGKKYGPLVMVEIMGQKMCIINSAKVASDLLNSRSSIYSDRPAMPMVNDLMGWDFNMGLQPYGPVYKKHRKVFQTGFDARTTEEYTPIQTREVTMLLSKLLRDPAKFDDHLRVTNGAIIMMIAFGYQPKEKDDFVRIAEQAQLAMVSAARPGAYLVDFMPFLKHVPEWVPGAGFKRVAREGWELAQDLQNKPFAWAKKQLESGVAQPSFFTKLMETKGVVSPDPVEEEQIIQKACAVLYATGADTILSAILTFVLAMLHAPEIQQKAQEELDRVVGNDRLPNFSDRSSLPYITAIAKEAMRWESVIPLGVPHRVMQDDIYEGYLIPKGTTIIANQWGMSHDESIYPDPMEFRPERFLEAKDGDGARDPNTIAFGWGRRICPGRFLAENSLWLHVATMLACFNFARAVGPDGKEIVPPRVYTSGLASRPQPFPCKLTPRNGDVVKLIDQCVTAAQS